MKRFAAAMALACSLAACVTGGGLLPVRSATPEWVQKPPADTAALYYGVGEGADLEAARRTALRDVAAKLRVSVSSTVDSQVTVANESADRFSRTRISEEVRKTTFGKHQLERTESSGNTVYALVSVDRAQLVTETRTRLDEVARSARQALASARATQGLDRLRLAGKAKAQADDGGDLLSLLGSASPGFDRAPYARDFAAAIALHDETRQNLGFRIQNRSADEDVAALLRQGMSESGLRVQDTGATPAIVAIAVESHEQTIYGSVIVRLKINLSLRSERGGVFAQKDYNVEGSSASDRVLARQAAVRKLAAQFKGKGIAAAIGLDAGADR
jgi:ribosomal protein L16/L10AE